MSQYKTDLHRAFRKARRKKITQDNIAKVFARKIVSFDLVGKNWVLKTTDGRELRSPVKKGVLVCLAVINDYDVTELSP